jgi:hypothetical protein
MLFFRMPPFRALCYESYLKWHILSREKVIFYNFFLAFRHLLGPASLMVTLIFARNKAAWKDRKPPEIHSQVASCLWD